MAKLKPGTVEHIVIDTVDHVKLRAWCRVNGLSKNVERFVCARARKNATVDTADGHLTSIHVDGARTTFGGLWVIPTDTPTTVIPEHGAGGAIVRRADGRVRFVVYLTDAEYASLRDKHEIVDLREQRKTRRANRKTKNA